MEHELVFGRAANQVENEIERVLVHDEMSVVQYDIAWIISVSEWVVKSTSQTSRFFSLLPQPFLERALFFESEEVFWFTLRMTLGPVVFGQYAMAFRVENHESIYAVKRQVHLQQQTG
jgi:hypothetical protein